MSSAKTALEFRPLASCEEIFLHASLWPVLSAYIIPHREEKIKIIFWYATEFKHHTRLGAGVLHCNTAPHGSPRTPAGRGPRVRSDHKHQLARAPFLQRSARRHFGGLLRRRPGPSEPLCTPFCGPPLNHVSRVKKCRVINKTETGNCPQTTQCTHQAPRWHARLQ